MSKAFTIGLLLLPAACRDARYRVVVELPGDSSEAERVEVSLLGSCAEANPIEAPPARTVLQIEVDPAAGETPSLGSAPAGRFGLHGRAWRSGCALYAAGCESVRLETDGDGTLVLRLELVPERGCAATEECRDGRCVPTDGGGDGDGDADGDADGDGGPSCTPELGRCGRDEDCCANRCLGGICLACNETGGPCDADFDCCSGACGADDRCLECHGPTTPCAGQPAGYCCAECQAGICTQ